LVNSSTQGVGTAARRDDCNGEETQVLEARKAQQVPEAQEEVRAWMLLNSQD
jgi:hypothetical protein